MSAQSQHKKQDRGEQEVVGQGFEHLLHVNLRDFRPHTPRPEREGKYNLNLFLIASGYVMRPTLRQMEYITAVARLGRFNLAAEALNVSQPSL